MSSPEARYQNITTLGRGGMGEVFLAAHPAAGPRAVAVIKRIWPELADEPEFVAMFLDEARLALRLRHRNVVQTLEVGEEVGKPAVGLTDVPDHPRYFLAMEYLPGQPLSQIARRLRGSESFTLQMRLSIVVEVLRALEYAHDLQADNGVPLGIVHRDISPDNVFVTYEGAVKLMDFGVAKSRFASHQTRPGVFKGRYTYAAPEQLRGYNVDRRADLFAVGVILWELLTDRRMFRGRSEAEVVRTLSGHDPLPQLPADWPIPPELRQVCSRALALEPRARYQNATRFRRDLADVLALCLPAESGALGPTVARAFRAEKQALEWLVERHFQSTERGVGSRSRNTRLGREERTREVSSAGTVSSERLPLIWSRFATADRISAVVPLPEPRPERITESAPAVEIGDRTQVERLPLRRPSDRQVALGLAAVLAGLFVWGTFGRPPAKNAETAETAEEPSSPSLIAVAGPRIEPLPAPMTMTATPAPVAAASPMAPAPVASPTADAPIVPRRRLLRRVVRPAETPAPSPAEETKPEGEAAPAPAPAQAPATPPGTALAESGPPTLDTRNPYGP